MAPRNECFAAPAYVTITAKLCLPHLSAEPREGIGQAVELGLCFRRKLDTETPKTTHEDGLLAANEPDTPEAAVACGVAFNLARVGLLCPTLENPLLAVIRQPPPALGVKLEKWNVSHRAGPRGRPHGFG